jgi:hypothetical protein
VIVVIYVIGCAAAFVAGIGLGLVIGIILAAPRWPE